MGSLHLTLIRPHLYEGKAHDAMEPLVMALLEGLSPPWVETVFYDDRIEAVPVEEPTDLVAITVETYTARRAYRIADRYRRRGVPVVMGGYHPTLLSGEAAEHADALVLGDAEGVWETVLEDARAGRLRAIYRQERPPPLAGQRPDRGIFGGKRYAPISLVQFGRGCRYACDFCSIRAFYGSSVRYRPVAEVLEEIEGLDGRLTLFVDDNLFADPARARQLVSGLEGTGVRWACQCTLDVADDPDLVRRMAAAGCVLALIGFESLDAGSLRQMGKGWHLKSVAYADAIRRIRDAGIMVYGSFLFGYDGDTADSFDRTLEFALRHKLCLANFNPLTPTPGAPLYARLEREGRLIHDRWWLDPSFRYGDAMFHPRGMTAEELTRGCYRARRSFNTFGSIARRLVGRRGNHDGLRGAGIYLLANFVSRREIHAKQGRELGAA